MNADVPTLHEAVVKTMVAHTITYFLVGVLAFLTLDYAKTVQSDPSAPASSRPVSDPMAWQIRSSNDPEVLFGVVFYLLGESFFHRSRGWLILWVTLVVIGILGQLTDGLGSIEGLVYSRVPVPYQLLLLHEAFIQSFLPSILLFYWNRHPRKWLNWVLGGAFLLILIFPALGLLAARFT